MNLSYFYAMINQFVDYSFWSWALFPLMFDNKPLVFRIEIIWFYLNLYWYLHLFFPLNPVICSWFYLDLEYIVTLTWGLWWYTFNILEEFYDIKLYLNLLSFSYTYLIVTHIEPSTFVDYVEKFWNFCSQFTAYFIELHFIVLHFTTIRISIWWKLMICIHLQILGDKQFLSV